MCHNLEIYILNVHIILCISSSLVAWKIDGLISPCDLMKKYAK